MDGEMKTRRGCCRLRRGRQFRILVVSTLKQTALSSFLSYPPAPGHRETKKEEEGLDGGKSLWLFFCPSLQELLLVASSK